MANLNVTYDDITNTAAQLRQGQSEIEQKLTELSSLVDNLVGSGFQTDQASGAFDDSFTQFVTGTKQAVDGLAGLAKYLDSASQTLQQTDTELANAIKSN